METFDGAGSSKRRKIESELRRSDSWRGEIEATSNSSGLSSSDGSVACCCSSKEPETKRNSSNQGESVAEVFDFPVDDEFEISIQIEPIRGLRRKAGGVKMSKKRVPPARSNLRGGSGGPSEAELEEFFAAAERRIQQGFIQKYNYDVVNDAPLAEGRYEWVPLKQ